MNDMGNWNVSDAGNSFLSMSESARIKKLLLSRNFSKIKDKKKNIERIFFLILICLSK